jgi:hypothetical protein
MAFFRSSKYRALIQRRSYGRPGDILDVSRNYRCYERVINYSACSPGAETGNRPARKHSPGKKRRRSPLCRHAPGTGLVSLRPLFRCTTSSSEEIIINRNRSFGPRNSPNRNSESALSGAHVSFVLR